MNWEYWFKLFQQFLWLNCIFNIGTTIFFGRNNLKLKQFLTNISIWAL